MKLNVKLSVLAVMALGLASCAKDISTPIEGPPTAVGISSGGNAWQPPTVQCSPTPRPIVNSSGVAQSPAPVAPAEHHWWCSIGKWLPECNTPAPNELAGVPTPAGSASPAALEVPLAVTPAEPAPCATIIPTHNTQYCQVNEDGKIISSDTITSDDSVHSLAGGCVQRSIRDTWATLLTMLYEKPSDVDTYTVKSRPDLINAAEDLFFAFDVFNEHDTAFVHPSWTVRWYFFIPKDPKTGNFLGTYENPEEVAIRFQKIDGTSFISSLSATYLLDRVTDDVTSFLMIQDANATQYGKDDGYNSVKDNLDEVRTDHINETLLPAHFPSSSQGEAN